MTENMIPRRAVAKWLQKAGAGRLKVADQYWDNAVELRENGSLGRCEIMARASARARMIGAILVDLAHQLNDGHVCFIDPDAVEEGTWNTG